MKLYRKKRNCEMCKGNGSVEKYWIEGVVMYLCLHCGKLQKERKLMKTAFRFKEESFRSAIIKLAEKKFNKEEILFICELTEEQFNAEISRMKNLVQFQSLFKNFSEVFSIKNNSGDAKKDENGQS